MNLKMLSLTRTKQALQLDVLATSYELSNHADGKSAKTIGWYNDILKSYFRFLQDSGRDLSLVELSIGNVRNYIYFLQQRPRFQGHRFTPSNGKVLSPRTVQCHVRALKAFSSWLFRESYTEGNRLQNQRLPKAPSIMVRPLNEAETRVILNKVETKHFSGMRNHALIATLLDTGLRASEIANTAIADVNLDEGYIKVMGKGSKERVVPIGAYVQKVLWRYSQALKGQFAGQDHGRLFVTSAGRSITVNSIKLLFSRLAKKTGITRLHAHLCRHTFSVNYLLNGGDIFTLQEILGHTSLDMVRHYLHFTNSQVVATHHEHSPMDKLYRAKNA